jgi:ABC-type multidrug transport system fused ATPase/permease subunit
MARPRRLRRYIVGLLIVLTSLSAVAATVALWARSQVLNTDRWTQLAERIIEEPEVVDRLAFRLSTSIVQGLEVEERIEAALGQAERLPAQAALLAGPFASRIPEFLEDRIRDFLASERGQQLWVELNRRVHQRAVAILRGETRPGVTVEGGTVTLNLVPLMNRVLAGAGDLLTDILGRPVSLPTVEELQASGGADQARALLEDRLGVELPNDFGEMVVFRSDQLAAGQDAVRLLDRFVVLLLIVTVVLIAASLVLSVARRRTLIQLGIGLLLATLIARLVVRAIQQRIVDRAAADSREALQEVLGNVFEGLLDFTTFLIVAGIVVGVAAYLAGRPAWLVRIGDRARTGAASARFQRFGRWAGERRDGLRLGGVIAAVVLLFLVELSWFSVIVVLLLLAAYQLGVSYLLSLPGQDRQEPEDLQVQPDQR